MNSTPPRADSCGTRLTLDLFNYRAGGLAPTGTYDFQPLIRAFLDDPDPDVVALCECKFWHARGRRPLHRAVADLAALTGRPYIGELATGPLGTAIIYDPRILYLEADEEPAFDDKRNLFRFRLRADPTFPLHIYVEHWPYADAEQRLARARLLGTFGTSTIPTLIVGDLNCSSSGPRVPAIDWDTVPIGVRDHKGRQHPDGSWHPDTRPLDRLIGAWNEATGRRVDGAGFHHLAELDPQAPQRLPATVNAGSGLHIDYLLANQALLANADVVPGSYHVHIPPGGPSDWPSDHRRISCTLHIHTDHHNFADRPPHVPRPPSHDQGE